MNLTHDINEELLKFSRSLSTENFVLRRENSILRSELKERLVSEWIVNYEMSEEETEKAAEQYIIHMVAHNEGAE